MPYRIALLIVILAACAAPSVTTTSAPTKAPGPTNVGNGPITPTVMAQPSKETLAQCLSRKGLRLFGASWCHPCHVQIGLFGAQAPDVPYTDCQPEGTFANIPECDALDVNNYPTWLFSDGYRAIGVRSLEWLSASTDCPLR